MKIVIFGASGKTGTLLTKQALSKGHQVTAYLRREGALAQNHPNLRIVIGNLDNKGKLKEALQEADVVFSTLGGGSLTKHAPDIIAGINNIVTIMEQPGTKRFIYLSSIGAGESRNLMGSIARFLIADVMLRVPLADHSANEQRIMKSKLQWTLVRPGGLTDGSWTGILKHGSEKILLKGSPKISRANVASFMLEQLDTKAYINKGVWLFEQ
ncbi:MAG: NAD(P)H-binding protein [Bacteroidota bacterium]